MRVGAHDAHKRKIILDYSAEFGQSASQMWSLCSEMAFFSIGGIC